jgi:opine dehydrogenase
MRFCVIGAGSGGRAFAAYLSEKGQTVSLYNRSFSRINEIRQKGGIRATGELEGFFPIDMVTQNMKLAVNEADIILVVTPAFAHKDIATQIAPFLKDGQIIILNPGRTFGAVEFLRIIEQTRGRMTIFVGETQTLLFTARELKGNRVKIIKIKNSVNFSTFPDKYSYLICDILNEFFPQLVPLDDYLEVTLNNIGMLLHPALSLLNAGPIDYGKQFKFYQEGATPQICQVLEQIEIELNEIFRILGLRQLRYEKWANKCYGINASCIYDAIQQINAYKNINAPNKLITRYFTEDVPTGLVAISSLGRFLGIETPTIDAIIQLSSIICGKNFSKVGRTVEELKIEGYLKQRIFKKEYLMEDLSFDSKQKLRTSQDDI